MTPRYLELFRVLAEHDVDLIVVGGVAAILEGAPIATFDLDVLYDLDANNLTRLLAALRSIDARYRDPAGRTILPSLDRLANLRLSLLATNLGPLDVLAKVGPDLSYRDLLSFSSVREIEGLSIRVLDLAKLIELKEHANRDKDRAVLPVLKRLLAVKTSRAAGSS